MLVMGIRMIALAGLAGALASSTAAAQGGASIDKARWLAGCWEMRRGTSVTVEMWMPPDGGMMLGASRATVGGTLREWEQLRLGMKGTALVYTALPSGQNETAFTAVAVSDSALTFENLAHDFPKRILYARHGADSLVASIEGPGRDGGNRRIEVPMKRISCTG
jgi:uncharacterized protein DUF6265